MTVGTDCVSVAAEKPITTDEQTVYNACSAMRMTAQGDVTERGTSGGEI